MRVHLITFGCKANQYDSAQFQRALEARGARAVDDPRQPRVGRGEQRGRRGQEEGRRQHRGQDRVMGQGGVGRHVGGQGGAGGGLSCRVPATTASACHYTSFPAATAA